MKNAGVFLLVLGGMILIAGYISWAVTPLVAESAKKEKFGIDMGLTGMAMGAVFIYTGIVLLVESNVE